MWKCSLAETLEPTTTTFFDLVRTDLRKVEARMLSSPGNYHENLEAAIAHLLSSGGKRIRPTLVLLSGGMLLADVERITTLAAAIEMLHTATLVHDDLIDDSLMRRGIPTLNAQWTPGATVLTGDYVFARAAFLAAQTGSLEVMQGFAKALMNIVDGEIRQLFNTHSEDLRKDYYDRIYAKTASLFELATEGAALIAGAEPEATAAMRDLGYQIGMAFQIVDDVLDFTGAPEKVGKPVASDLRQGLVTLPAILFLEEHPLARPAMERLIDGRLDGSDLEQLVIAIRDSSAIDKAMTMARQFTDVGIEILDRLSSSAEREAIRELANYIVRRTS
jgi:geranylgeranyl pyrophosphate synthase